MFSETRPKSFETFEERAPGHLVCFTADFSVVTQRSFPLKGKDRDVALQDAKCISQYMVRTSMHTQLAAPISRFFRENATEIMKQHKHNNNR